MGRLSVTSTTSPHPSPCIQIISEQWVTMYAVGLESIDRGYGFTAKQVLSLRNCLKVPRIYTHTDSAQVINLETIWDRTLSEHVREDMRIDQAPSDTNTPISLAIGAPGPHPVVIGFMDLKPEPFLRRHADMVSP